MRILLIGSNGLMATAIGRACNRSGFTVDVVGRSQPRLYTPSHFTLVDLMHVDASDLDALSLSGYDLIAYAAGAGVQSYLRENSEQIFALNVSFPIGLISHLTKIGFSGAVVTFGSYFEIGENTVAKEWTEFDIMSSLCRVPNDYCVSKRMLTRFASSVEVPFAYYHLILPTVYAEYESSNRLIPYTVDCIRRRVAGEYTTGNQVRQYVHADDVAGLMFEMVRRRISGGIYNIPSGDTLSVREVVYAIYAAMDRKVPDGLFGCAERDDLKMSDLRLDTKKLSEFIPLSCGHALSATFSHSKNLTQTKS